MKKKEVKQGDIWMYSTTDTVGCEQNAKNGRCCVVVQSDIGNEFSPTTIIIPLTKKTNKSYVPQHYELKREIYNFLNYNSIALVEQVRCIDKRRLERKLGEINKDDLEQIINHINENFIL